MQDFIILHLVFYRCVLNLMTTYRDLHAVFFHGYRLKVYNTCTIRLDKRLHEKILTVTFRAILGVNLLKHYIRLIQRRINHTKILRTTTRIHLDKLVLSHLDNTYRRVNHTILTELSQPILRRQLYRGRDLG